MPFVARRDVVKCHTYAMKHESEWPKPCCSLALIVSWKLDTCPSFYEEGRLCGISVVKGSNLSTDKRKSSGSGIKKTPGQVPNKPICDITTRTSSVTKPRIS